MLEELSLVSVSLCLAICEFVIVFLSVCLSSSNARSESCQASILFEYSEKLSKERLRVCKGVTLVPAFRRYHID